MRLALSIPALLLSATALAATSSDDGLAQQQDAAAYDYRQCMANRASAHYDRETFPVDIVRTATKDCIEELTGYLRVMKVVTPELTGSEGPGNEFHVKSRTSRLYEMTFLETLQQIIDRRLAEYR